MLKTETTVELSTRNVFVIDDDSLLREAVGQRLEQDGFSVMGFPSARTFLKALPDLSPGVILVDVRMPEIDGLELQRRLVSRGLSWPVIVMSAFPGTYGTVMAMRQGAFTVLDKPIDLSELLDLMEDAFHELQRRCDQLTDLPPELGGLVRYLDRLTERERQIIDKVYSGSTNRTIAETLQLSVKTVEKHRGRAMRKMQVRTFAQLIRLMDREMGNGPD